MLKPPSFTRAERCLQQLAAQYKANKLKDRIDVYKAIVGHKGPQKDRSMDEKKMELLRAQWIETQSSNSGSDMKNPITFYSWGDREWLYCNRHWPTENAQSPMNTTKIVLNAKKEKQSDIFWACFEFCSKAEESFILKSACRDRDDNTCLWVWREALPSVLEFVDQKELKDMLLEPPPLVPAYKGIMGISKETSESSTAALAQLVWEALHKHQIVEPSLDILLEMSQSSNLDTWDKLVMKNLLNLIKKNGCPITDKEHNLADMVHKWP